MTYRFNIDISDIDFETMFKTSILHIKEKKIIKERIQEYYTKAEIMFNYIA